MSERKRKHKPNVRLRIIIAAALVALAVLGGVVWFALSGNMLLGWQVVGRDAEAVTLSSGALPKPETFSRFASLKELDLRGREDVDAAYVDALRAVLPEGCAVLWTIRLTDGAFDNTAASLALPNCSAEDAALLPYFPDLSAVDASGSTAYAALFEAARALPAAMVTYTLAVGDAVVSNTDTSLTAAGVSDVTALKAALPYFPALTNIDLSGGSVPDADMRALRAAFGVVHFRWTVHLGDKAYDSEATELKLEGVTFSGAAEAIEALSNFFALKTADLRGTGLTAAQEREVAGTFAGVRFVANLCGLPFSTDSTELDLTTGAQVNAQSLLDGLPSFTSVTTVRLPSGAVSEEALAPVLAAFPDILFVREIELYGRTVSTDAVELDISGTILTDPAEAEALLRQLPRLTKLIMCECGLTDDQMAALSERYPSVRFVWAVVIGGRVVRTDAIGFSTLNPSKHAKEDSSEEYKRKVKTAVRLKEGDIEALKYCTDLVALDLGHNFLTNADLAVIGTLKNLQILILADNKITDISALSTLSELKYIELFMNTIADVSPLAKLTNLLDVNICNIRVADVSSLAALTGLERLWFSMNPIPREDAKALAAALPNCECNYTVSDETEGGWREHERYFWMRGFFK